jgi:hypothetical protein
MQNAPIVPGVPTPYFFQNRVYPSRFHGGIWTRPVFGFPKIARPQDVFTRGYDIDREVPQPTLSGLGAAPDMDWQTGDGVFKPGGYGGGVFDSNISGLGSLGNGLPRRASRRGWSVRGIHGLGDDSADYPWKVKSDKTSALQTATNVALLKAGLCPITVDGKLGGATCGARNHLTVHSQELLGQEMSFANPSTCDGHEGELKIPGKKSSGCGAGGSPITPAPSASPMVIEAGMSSSTKRVLGFALGGVLAIGAVVMLRKR